MTLKYSTGGEGPAVVFLHGLFGSRDNLRGVSSRLEGEFLTVRLDLPHHGDSPHRDIFSYSDCAADVLETIDGLGIDRFGLVGHSMGGKVAMTLALQEPRRTACLVVADIAPRTYKPSHTEIFAAMQRLEEAGARSRAEADEILAAGDDGAAGIEWPEVRAFLLKSVIPGPDGVYRWKLNLPVLGTEYPVILDWPGTGLIYSGPVLVIRGESSSYLPDDAAALFEKNFPNCRIETLKGTGHWLHAENPTGFHSLLEPFLRDRLQLR